MTNPLISVIIPNYCHARYLNQRIDSILAQTYQNFEIIILDDCSPDDGASRQVIESYRNNSHVSNIVYNEVNSGCTFAQWLRGIELAKGELCWIAESDDSCRPQLLETLVKFFELDEEVVLSSCRSLFINENNQITGGIGLVFDDTIKNGSMFISDHMVEGNFICNSGMALFRRDVALTVDRQFADKKYAGAGDMMFWIEIAERGKVATSYQRLNYFRRYEGTVTHKREIDGSNSYARKYILDYEQAHGYVSFYRVWDMHLREEQYLRKLNGMSPEKRAELLRYWHLNFIQRFLHRCIYSFKYRIRMLFNLENKEEAADLFNKNYNTKIKSGDITPDQFARAYYNIEN